MDAVAASSEPRSGRRVQRTAEDTLHALQEALDGRYVLERELGRGGMGIVYLAWDPDLERRVALKILPPAIATHRRRDAFLREARIAARLEHDNIVRIHSVGAAGPFVYYTMAYVRGETLLDRILAQGPLPVADVLRILHDVARAVDYAHARGVIHHDLKPHNILIEQAAGRPYVTDFGTARIATDGRLAGNAPTFATFAYMSPEQAAGLATDRRSDVYSLGVVGYVMAMGQPLFSGTVEEVVKQHIVTPAPPLPVLGLHLDTTLARAVGRCLAKHPEKRFQSAGDLARALALAPELRADLPEPQRRFVNRLRLESGKFAWAGLLLGFAALQSLGTALSTGDWGAAAIGLGFLTLALASPALGVLPATRRLLRAHHGRADIVQALDVELDRQREQQDETGRRATEKKATVSRWILRLAGALVLLGFVLAQTGLDLPEWLVAGSLIVGTLTAPVAGAVVVVRERRRNALWGRRWLAFWQSRLGGWTVKLAGLGLRRGPPESARLEPTTALATGRQSVDAASGDWDDFNDVVHLTDVCVRRSRAWLAARADRRARLDATPTLIEVESEEHLERRLAVLEELLDTLRSVEAGAEGSLTADVEEARQVCVEVEGLIEGRDWRV